MASAFVEYLEGELKARGWSRYRLANAVPQSDSLVYGLFNDDRARAGEELLRDVARVLGIDAEWLEILSGERAKPGTCRRRLSAALREARNLRAENQRLRERLGEIVESVDGLVGDGVLDDLKSIAEGRDE